MNPMTIMSQAEKLSVPELQRSIQRGVIPAFIGVPLLQEKVKRAKQMQMGMAAQQPKRPSVAEQVGQEARQASVEDMMRERARMMQGEMGQTGGISDFLPKPAEEAYAKGGPIAFAEGTYGEDIRTQLQRLLDQQKAADYGWTEEAASAYEPKYYQTPEEARESMSRRNLARTKQPYASFDDYQKAQARARAQTGLGVRSGETIEVPPYREPVTVRAPQATPPTGLNPYQYTGDILDTIQPNVRPVSGGLPNYSPVIEGRSYAHPTATPNADMEAAKAYYAENRGKRPMNAGQAFEQEMSAKRAAVKAAEDVQLNRAGKIAQFEGAGARLGSSLGADAQLVQKLSMPGITGYEYKDPAMRSRLQSLFGMEHLKDQAPDAYVGASERVAPKVSTAQTSQPTTENILNKNALNRQTPDANQVKLMQERIASGKQTPRASFDFANPNQVATDVLANPARANTDPDLWQWAIDYREQNPTKTPYAQATQVAQPQQAQPQQQEEKELTLAERKKEYHEAAGENKGIGVLQNRLSEREAALAKEEDRAPWLALMQAGLATMAGTSPNAMSNIGQGGIAGLQAYTHSMNKLEDVKDKSFEIQAKLEEAQRAEELAAAKYGLESVQADKKAKQTARLDREKLANDMKIHEMTNATNLERERMQVGATKYTVDARNAAYGGTGKPTKLTDQQYYFNRVVEALEANPTWRPDLRHPDGSPNPIAIEAERKKTSTDRRMEGFMGDSMGTSMGSGMMSTQPDPRYRILSQQ